MCNTVVQEVVFASFGGINRQMTVHIFMFLGNSCQAKLSQLSYLVQHCMFLLVSLQDSEYIGDVYQDDVNQAALLLYRDKTDDALLMVRISGILKSFLATLRTDDMKKLSRIQLFQTG